MYNPALRCDNFLETHGQSLPIWETNQAASFIGAIDILMHDMPLSGAVGRAVPRQGGALAATPRGDARTTAGTWTREGTVRERQSGAVRVSCEELASRDGAGGTPAPRPEDGRTTGRGLTSGDGAGEKPALTIGRCARVTTAGRRAGRPHHGRKTGARRDAG